MQQYKKYKDSGIIWLGKIPEHWIVTTIRSLTHLKSDKNHPDYEVLSVYREYGVIKKNSREDNHNVTSEDRASYKAVNPTDLVINKMKAWQGSMGISKFIGIVSPAYITCSINNDLVYGDYIHYLLRCSKYVGEYNRLSYGVRIGQWDMHYEDFKKIYIALPPIEEQEKIAKFLDTKCRKIDEAIKQKEQTIELLKERQQAIIQRIVTRGITSDIELKDSGVNWIGLIPKHWKVQKLKYALNQVNIKLPTVGSELPYIGMENVESWTGKFIESDSEVEGLANYFNANNVLFGKLRPYLAKTYLPNHNGLCSTEFIVYDVLENNASYMQRLLMTPEFINIVNSSTYGSKMPRANSDFIGNIKIALPLPKEQKQIAKHLEIIANKTEQTISLKKQEIELLKEYKHSLINDVVTGKIKIGTNEK